MASRDKRNQNEMLRNAKIDILQSNQSYLETLQIAIEKLGELNPTDRMDFAAGITLIVEAMTSSIKGWNKWIDPITLNTIAKEQYDDIFPKMRELAIAWLTVDKNITEFQTKKLEKLITEEIEKISDDRPFYTS